MAVGALVAELLAVCLYLVVASQISTGIDSPLGLWWPLTFPALVGAVLGGLVSLARRRR
jgi:hypothetical protein